MMQKKNRLNGKLLLIFFLLLPTTAKAEDEYRNHQFHFRLGMLNNSISGGGVSKTYSVTNTIDLEYEIFSNSKNSTVVRGIIAHDLALDRTVYDFMGIGKRFYFYSTGIAMHTSGTGFELDHVPKKRFYYGFDVGYSSGVILVLQKTPLQTVTNMIDIGALAGGQYQISRSNALEAQFGYSYGYGFSGVAASAMTMRMLIGFIHSF